MGAEQCQLLSVVWVFSRRQTLLILVDVDAPSDSVAGASRSKVEEVQFLVSCSTQLSFWLPKPPNHFDRFGIRRTRGSSLLVTLARLSEHGGAPVARWRWVKHGSGNGGVATVRLQNLECW